MYVIRNTLVNKHTVCNTVVNKRTHVCLYVCSVNQLSLCVCVHVCIHGCIFLLRMSICMCSVLAKNLGLKEHRSEYSLFHGIVLARCGLLWIVCRLLTKLSAALPALLLLHVSQSQTNKFCTFCTWLYPRLKRTANRMH